MGIYQSIHQSKLQYLKWRNSDPMVCITRYLNSSLVRSGYCLRTHCIDKEGDPIKSQRSPVDDGYIQWLVQWIHPQHFICHFMSSCEEGVTPETKQSAAKSIHRITPKFVSGSILWLGPIRTTEKDPKRLMEKQNPRGNFVDPSLFKLGLDNRYMYIYMYRQISTRTY